VSGQSAGGERRAVLSWRAVAGSHTWQVVLELEGQEPEEARVDARALAKLGLESELKHSLHEGRGVERLPAEREAVTRRSRERGQVLWDLLLPGAVGKRLRRSIEQAKRERARLRLEILEPRRQSPFAGLPWELLFVERADRFLGLLEQVTLTRRTEAPAVVAGPRRRRPSRLLVVDASPAGCAGLEVEREWELLQRTLREASVAPAPRRLANATRAGLVAELRREPADVLHFIGHGQGPGGQVEAGLAFEGSEGGADWVDGSELADLIRSAQTELPALVVLNACHGGASDELSGVAADLLAAGVPAVVAMRWQITDQAAVHFAAAFYAGLSRGERVDVALAAARRDVNGQVPGLEWSLPVLYEAARGANLGKGDEAGPFARSAGWSRSRWGWAGAGLAVTLALGTLLAQASGRTKPALLTSDPRCPTPAGMNLPMAYLPAAPAAGVPRPYCLAKTELTRQQQAAILKKPAPPAKEQRLPQGSLSWAASQDLLLRLNALPGAARFRLPTEAEWTSAARYGRTERRAFTFGDDPDELVEHGNCESEENRDGYEGVAPVASFEPSEAGLFDLHGNLAEWVADQEVVGPPPPPGTGLGSEPRHAKLGGSYDSTPLNCRIDAKGWSGASTGQATTGLRVAAEPAP
jgi:hypothetical protein